jgi:hypothetical protein
MARRVASSAAALAVALLVAIAACSSKGKGASPSDGGAPETGYTRAEAGPPGPDAGGGDDGPAGPDGTGGSCPDDTPFTPQTYTTPAAHQGVCAPGDVQAFLTACVDTPEPTICDAWLAANVASDAGAGTACGNCIFAPANDGGVERDPTGAFGPNYFGCIAILDPTHGSACAPAFQDVSDCENLECADCADDTAAQICAGAVDQTICASYVATETTACSADFADGGAGATCSPAGTTGSKDLDFTYVITLICGGGAADSGGD